MSELFEPDRVERPRRRGAVTARSVAVVGAALIAAGLVRSMLGSDVPTASAAPSVKATPLAIPFFGTCHYGGGTNCVVDGDTFYYGRDKIRIANIDAPDTHPPSCAAEGRLGNDATDRLRALLNSGEIRLSRIDRDEDLFGHKLRTVAVDGADVGDTMVGEGLARYDADTNRSWC